MEEFAESPASFRPRFFCFAHFSILVSSQHSFDEYNACMSICAPLIILRHNRLPFSRGDSLARLDLKRKFVSILIAVVWLSVGVSCCENAVLSLP